MTPHPVHGRIRQLGLTERGQSVLAEGKSIVGALEGKLTAHLTGSEEGIVRRWLVETADDGEVP